MKLYIIILKGLKLDQRDYHDLINKPQREKTCHVRIKPACSVTETS